MRGRDHLGDAELLQRRERHGQHDGGAVRIGDDLPLPAARALLAGDQLQVIGIDLRHQQRHVALHAMIARVRNDDVAGLRRRPARSRWRREASIAEKSSRGALPGLHSSHREVGDARPACAPPRCHVAASAILLAGGAVARAEPRQVEPRMALQKLDEMLAHHAGGAEDADFDSAFA